MAVILNSTEYIPVTYTHPNNNWSGCHILGAGIYPNINGNSSKIVYPDPPTGSHGINNKYNNIIVVMDHSNDSKFSYYPSKWTGDLKDIGGNVGTHRTGFLPYKYYKASVYQLGEDYSPYLIQGQLNQSSGNNTAVPPVIRINTSKLTQYSKISTRGYMWTRFRKFDVISHMASTSSVRLSNNSNLTAIQIDTDTSEPSSDSAHHTSNTSKIIDTFDFSGSNYRLVANSNNPQAMTERQWVYTDFGRDTSDPRPWQFTYMYLNSPCRMNLAVGGSSQEFDLDVIRSIFIITIFEDN